MNIYNVFVKIAYKRFQSNSEIAGSVKRVFCTLFCILNQIPHNLMPHIDFYNFFLEFLVPLLARGAPIVKTFSGTYYIQIRIGFSLTSGWISTIKKKKMVEPGLFNQYNIFFYFIT